MNCLEFQLSWPISPVRPRFLFDPITIDIEIELNGEKFMKQRLLWFVAVVFSTSLLFAAESTHKLAKSSKAPAGMSKKVTAVLNAEGHRIDGPKGPLCEFWLVKSLEVKPGFKPSLNVNYPFATGQLIGALRVAEKAEFTDFRGQPVKPGVYTLRYGRQPEDGNHIGTSELYDFLLAIPAKIDRDPKPIASIDQLSANSAKAGGSTHPAIFSLLPSKKGAESASLTHDAGKEFWILQLVGTGKENKKSVQVPIRLVAVGKSDE